ncbi:MAG: hypothetical protein JWM59_2000 [Verrucomicrobiales bacterium]|nr:hypothetical protein [Verrucomicrobiales bacterium]
MKLLRFLLPLLCATAVLAGEPKPDAEGWITLFNGKDFTGFTSADGGPVKWSVEDGAMCGDKKLGDIWTTRQFGDFILEVEFKTTGNSGVFFRTSDPKDNVQTGIEIQVENPGGPDKHSVGAIYDLVPPSKNAAKKDAWNKYVITAKGPHITVVLNGEKINEMNLDHWTSAGKNPDGSDNKFSRAVSQFARSGHIGFQDHDHKVWYRNVRVKPLDLHKS